MQQKRPKRDPNQRMRAKTGKVAIDFVSYLFFIFFCFFLKAQEGSAVLIHFSCLTGIECLIVVVFDWMFQVVFFPRIS